MEILDIIVESNQTELFTAMSVFGTISFIGNIAFSLLQLQGQKWFACSKSKVCIRVPNGKLECWFKSQL